MNINEEEAVGRRVKEERSWLESGEQRRRVANERPDVETISQVSSGSSGCPCVHTFLLGIMVEQEDMFRHPRQKKILGRMLAKVLIPYIYKNRVWCLDETLWPISMREFDRLNHQLSVKF